MALEKHIGFAEAHKIELGHTFPSLLASLISSRPGVFSESMLGFPEMRSLSIRVLHGYFLKYVNNKDCAGISKDDVIIVLCGSALENQQVTLPLQILKSLSVLLNIWDDEGELSTSTSSARAVQDIVDSILISDEAVHIQKESGGLAGARFAETDAVAVSVESVGLGLGLLRARLVSQLTIRQFSGSCWRRLEVILLHAARPCRHPFAFFPDFSCRRVYREGR
jgi:hypothetical protein